MILGSIRSRKRISEIASAAFIVAFAWLIQLAVLSKLPFGSVLCNLPLTLTIVWGVTFGSPVGKPSPDELRVSSFGTVLFRQLLSGSPSGAIVGAFFAALASSVLPIYPVSYPLIGWIAGYFSLKNFNQAAFLCIPLVVLLSFLGEMLMACQLALIGRPEVFSQLVLVGFPEALLNALIAPVLFFPMRGWYEFSQWRKLSVE